MIIPYSIISDAIISGGASLLGSAINGVTSLIQGNQNYKYAQKLMDKQNALNVANWQMQNAYNDPKNQMSRLKSAGINPDLFYANGASGIVNGTSPQSSLGSASVGPGVNSDFGQSTLSAMLLDSQKKNIDASTRKLNAEAGQTEATTPWVSEKIKSEIALNEQNAKTLNENIEKIRSETELNKVIYEIQNRQNEINAALKDTQISASLASLGATEKQSQVIIDNFSDLYTAQIKLAVAQSYASYVQSDASAYNASTARQQYQLDAIIRSQEVAVKKYEASFRKSVADSDIKVKDKTAESLTLQNRWRSELVKSGKFGDALHSVLSIPVNALGGFFH